MPSWTVEQGDYTLEAGATLLALLGCGATAIVAIAVGAWHARRMKRHPERTRGALGTRSVVAVGFAVVGVVASATVALAGHREGAILEAFPFVYFYDVGAAVLAGAMAVVLAFRTGSPRAVAMLLPAWLVAQAGAAHAVALHQRLPSFAIPPPARVHVGQTVRLRPVPATRGYEVEEWIAVPEEPGRHARVVTARSTILAVELELSFDAVAEEGDPLFPLASGNEWLLRSEEGPVEARITVGDAVVEDGLRIHDVSARLVVGTEGDRITVGGPARVYEADGVVVDLDDGEPYFTREAEQRDGTVTCALGPLPSCRCDASAEPPTRLLPGPVSCAGSYPRGLGEMFLAPALEIFSGGTANTEGMFVRYRLDLVRSGPAAPVDG